jgi:protein-disulfide isomerase
MRTYAGLWQLLELQEIDLLALIARLPTRRQRVAGRRSAIANQAETTPPMPRSMRRLALLLALAVAPATVVAQPEPLTEAQKEAVQQLIHDYYLEHPEALIEAFQRAQATLRAQQQNAAKRVLVERRGELVADPQAPVAGNAQGDVTIVEFFDYRCAYCKKAHPGMAGLLADEPGVRFVHKQLPVLGPDSVFAARAALASQAQGRYLAFHDAMMAASGALTNEAVFAIADQVGLDRARLARDMVSPEVEAALAKNAALAKALGINGTPSFVVGDTMIPGVAEPAALRQLVATQRRAAQAAGGAVPPKGTEN